MLTHPQFDPVALQLGPVAIRWYGLMYLVAFAQFYWLGCRRVARREPGQPLYGFSAKDVEDLLFYGVLGAVLGGRLGHVLFYQPAHYLRNPLEIFAVWEGGMAFHGGLIGVLVACALFARRKTVRYFDLMDFVAPLVPLGLAAGRLGNFINGELWGRVTDVPWAMVFPQSGSALARHPSQLYQLAGEGLLLFVFLWWYSGKPRPTGAVSGMFLVGYGICRFLVEFVREPDAHLGTVLGPFTMGQMLTVPMLLAGFWLMVRARREAR
ncbi:MAG: prolipoprotein diacylglyceryl transferase [Lautropia sp.]|nr:prolipoprotein diacylglyceryl transferase [Lautropia sp.]